MRKVKSVTKIILLILVLNGCASSDININNEYKIEYLNSNLGNTQIVFECFDYIDKKERIPATISINDIIFQSEFIDPIPKINILVKSNTYEIEAFFIGKETVKIKNIKVNSKDSILVKIYMKDSNEVLH